MKVFCVICVVIFSSGLLSSQDALSSPLFSIVKKNFDLPASSLNEAIVAFAIQSELSVVVDSQELEGFRSSPLFGVYTAELGLKLILGGAPFEYRFNSVSGALIISRRIDTDLKIDEQNKHGVRVTREEEVIVTASGIRTPLEKAPAIATVITADEIRLSGVNNLNNALELVPGLHVSLSSLSRLDFIYSIRGIHTGFNPHVLLLIDGVPVEHSAQGGRPILFRLPTTNISQIEIVRGPGSAIYGADAYSGVINVITKSPAAEPSRDLGARYGSFNSQELWVSGSTSLDILGFAYGFTYRASDGDNNRRINTDFQSGLDVALNTNASSAPGSLSTRYEIFDSHLKAQYKGWSISLWSWVSRNSGVGAGAAQALDPTGRDDSNLVLADINYQFGGDEKFWRGELRSSYQYYDTQSMFNLLPAGSTVPIGADGNINFNEPVGLVNFQDGLKGKPGGTTRDYITEFVSIFSGIKDHQWRLAIGAKYQELDSREEKNFGPSVIDGSEGVVDGRLTDVSDSDFVFVKDVSRSIRYVSLQDVWRLHSDWELTTGIRLDDYSDFGTTRNPRVALVWDGVEKINIKFLYGHAFRAPSFSEKFMDNNPILHGNPELKPEEIDTYELSFLWKHSNSIDSTISFFEYYANGLVEYMPSIDESTRKAKNARDQRGWGLELEVGWDLNSSARINSSFSLQKSINEMTNEKVPDAPGKNFMLDVYWTPDPKIFVNVRLNHVANRVRAEEDPRAAISDYTLVDMTVGFKIKSWDVTLGVGNAMNEDAREPSTGLIVEDYPLASRSYWLELSHSFK